MSFHSIIMKDNQYQECTLNHYNGGHAVSIAHLLLDMNHGLFSVSNH